MAHVLLPCDLPSWKEVQQLLLRVRTCKGVGAAHVMATVHEASSVSLDPDDSGPVPGHPGFERLARFLEEEGMSVLLADIAAWALRLPSLKPRNGIHYSLRRQEGRVSLERPLAASLVANAFFSTFPRRKAKTHPTLQDFSMADFFSHLDREGHRMKLQSLLRYFENLEPEPDGTIHFTRKVFQGPSLPGWLCSERPLVPLVVRPQGSIDEAEPWVFRGCSCSPSVGGNVLTESTSQESGLFFECPELLAALCFLESLVEGEALIVEGVRAPNTQDVNFCFLAAVCSEEGGSLDDARLLGSLNAASAAFEHEPRSEDCRRRAPPDGGESSSPRSSQSREVAAEQRYPKKIPVHQASSNFSMRTASESSVSRMDEEYYTADEESEAGSTGFVLGGADSEDESIVQTSHERLEDFRRRIRRRTRRKLSTSRRSSYSSGSSSDMEDIREETSIFTHRNACSEPSIPGATEDCGATRWISPEVLLSLRVCPKQLATCIGSGGHPKAYSHDGVRPNLPVPFRTKFFRRSSNEESRDDLSLPFSKIPTQEDSCCDRTVPSRCPVAVSANGSQLRALVMWLAASMAQLPALILYTRGEPTLAEVIPVYRQVLSRQWTVGDLACEVLRFCRNRSKQLTVKQNLFGQLLLMPQKPTKTTFKEESLD